MTTIERTILALTILCVALIQQYKIRELEARIYVLEDHRASSLETIDPEK